MSEDRELRDALEAAQHENRELRQRLEALEAFDPTLLQARIDALLAENGAMRERLERADEVRESWDARVRALRRELDIARQEQARLLSLLENERLAPRR